MSTTAHRWRWGIFTGAAIATAALLAAAGYFIGRDTSAPVTPAGDVVSSVSIIPASSPTPAALDAAAVLARLTAAGLPITNPTVQDETTDPNNMLGRPGGYTSRASFDLPGGDPQAELHTVMRGGVVEVFATPDAAQARSEYIQAIVQAAPMLGLEYHYLAGPVLVRIAGSVAPSQAANVEETVAAALS